MSTSTERQPLPARWRELGITLTGVLLCLYTVVEVMYLYLPPLSELAVFLMLSLIVAFLKFPLSENPRLAWIDLLGIALALVTGIYIVVEEQALMVRMGVPNSLDVAMGIAGALLVLEAARRTVGWILPALGVLAVAYAAFGAVLPFAWGGNPGFSVHRMASEIFLSEEGIYGPALGIMFRLVTLFIIFGVLLNATGGTAFIIDLSQSLFGRFSGGPGKVAVVSSSLFGTISGSAVANVMVNGWITIPMMKRTGFKPHVAAGVEAAASTGGQLMPPVMGSAAFMMIQFVGTSYLHIIEAAVLPAVLYYLALFAAIHFYSKRLGLKGVPPEHPITAADILKRGAVFFLPLVVVVLALLRHGPNVAVLYAMGTLLAVSSLRSESRLGPKKVVRALREGASDAVPTVCAAAAVGIIIAMVMLTGLGLRLPDLILHLAGNHLLIVLVLVMITSLVLGMGLPTVVCYLLLATTMAPALVRLGVGLMPAHLFILYFGILSMVTPPVALAAYAAGAIGGADLMQTGYSAWKLSLSGFIIPYMFVYGPPLLLRGDPAGILLAVLSSSVGVVVLGAVIIGYFITELKSWERAALLVASLLMIRVGWVTDVIGLVLMSAVLLAQWHRQHLRVESMGVIGH